MADAGAAVVIADAELTAARLRARRRSCSGTAAAWRDGRASAALARPDAAAAIAHEVLRGRAP